MTTMSPEIERELHELRRRAYGPHAGTGLKADDAARLEELESRARALRSVKLEVAPPAPVDAVSASPAGEATSAASAAAPAAPAATHAHRGWWRSRLLWLGVAAGAAAGALIAMAVSAHLDPLPDGTLHAAAEGGDPSDQSGIASYVGVDAETLVRFDDWKGFEVWTGRKADGEQCLFVNADQGVFDFGCGFRGLDPQVDLWVFEGMSSLVGETIPTGSMVRFVARGDAVDVWEQLNETVSAE